MKKIKIKILIFTITIAVGIFQHAYADEPDHVVVGQVKSNEAKPWAGLGFTKVKIIDNITYGLTRHRDAVGNFDKFTMDRSTDGGTTWQNQAQTLFTNEQITAQGLLQDEDYTYNKFESIKWFQCPSTGKWSIYAKRINATENGAKDYINGKQLFGATVVATDGEVDSPYDAIRVNFPYGSASGDLANITVDGKAYIISTGRDDHTIRFIELTSNCSDIVGNDVPGAQPAKTLQWYNDDGSAEAREAPSIFQHNGYFYMMTSGATGWRPNQQKYAFATEFLGDWSEMISIGDRTAYHSQVFYVKGITAQNGSNTKARIFSGTRNAQVWNGTDTREVFTPIYFNTPESLTTNYYDYLDIYYSTGETVGGNYDHGTRLEVNSADLEGYTDDISSIIDGDETTAWFKGNEDGRDVILYDLGQSQLIKALKIKQYDNFNANKPGEVELKVFRIRVEVGDGTNYINVFEDIVPSISWLHPLDLVDTQGQFVKITRLETHNGGSNAVQKHFGFYETEFWGNNAEVVAQIDEDFETDTIGQKPADWTVYTPNGIQATVRYDGSNGNVIKLTDNNNAETAYVKKEITPQSGSQINLTFNVQFDFLGGGEKLRLRQGTKTALEITNSNLVNGLAIAVSNTEHIKIANITANTWYSLSIKLSTDSNTFDVYLNEKMIWGGAAFQNNVTSIDTVFLGTGWSQSGYTAYFDDIKLSGPISDVEATSPTPVLFNDNFESGTGSWLLTKGTWTIGLDGNNNVLTKTETTGSGYISNGDITWADYTVTADVKRIGQSAGILGRYQASNKYYQFAIRDNNTYLFNVNNSGSWSQLASGSFNNNSTEYYSLKMQFSGENITIMINDQQIVTVTDNKISQGKIGLRSQNGSTSYDNITVE